MPLLSLRDSPAARRWPTALLAVVAAAAAVALAGCGSGPTEEPAGGGEVSPTAGQPSPTATASPVPPENGDTSPPPNSSADSARFSKGVHDFTLPTYSGEQVSLSDYLGEKHVLLVFYRAFW